MSIQLVMPSLGESVIEGTITKWLVHEGDAVTREQPVVSVATDNADSDVPAPQAGRILKILVPEGATVKVGEPLCEIEAGGASLPPNRPVNATVPAPPPEGMSARSEPPPGTAPNRGDLACARDDDRTRNMRDHLSNHARSVMASRRRHQIVVRGRPLTRTA